MTRSTVSFSICIPCYNDFEGLHDTLRSIVENFDIERFDQFHVLVGLNDCKFGEEDILKAQSRKLGIPTKFFKTRKYLVYDKSIIFLLSKVNTDFCLLVGCGEVVLPNLFNALLAFGENDTDFGLLPVQLQESGNKSTDLDKEGSWKTTTPGIFNKVVSGHIFRTSSLNFLIKPQPFVAFDWAHIEMSLIVQGNTKFNSFIYTCPAIKRNISVSGWWTKTDIYKQYIEYCDILLKYRERYPQLEFLRIELQKAFSQRMLLMILQVRANGLREAPLFFCKWINQFSGNQINRFIMKSALRLPKKMAVKIMILANWLIKRKQKKAKL